MTRRRWVTGVALAVVLVGCSAGDESDPGASSPAATSASASASSSAPPTPGEGEFVNPVLDQDFPDPGVLLVDGTYYAYATQGNGRHIQVASSTDLVTWEYLADALPRLPLWSTGNTWAPEVWETSAGFVMYYTARDPATIRPDGSGSQCITLAVAEEPAGPFVDESEGPLVCQADIGGTIDAFPFLDADGTRWLVYKNDGNCCGRTTRMWAQQLAEDGLSLVGEAVDMGIANDNAWERHVIEAPTIYLRDGTYYLFYSANDYASDAYAVGYATADTVTGPYTDAEENPILETAEDAENALGPGGQAIAEDADGDLWFLYHAWDRLYSQRTMWLDELVFDEGGVSVDGPEEVPQPAP
jgi:beta-xylosidase